MKQSQFILFYSFKIWTQFEFLDVRYWNSKTNLKQSESFIRCRRWRIWTDYSMGLLNLNCFCYQHDLNTSEKGRQSFQECLLSLHLRSSFGLCLSFLSVHWPTLIHSVPYPLERKHTAPLLKFWEGVPVISKAYQRGTLHFLISKKPSERFDTTWGKKKIWIIYPLGIQEELF